MQLLKPQYFSNGIWKAMPHDNFLINEANKRKLLIRPIELHLKQGEVVRVGPYVFKLQQEKKHEGDAHKGSATKAGDSKKPERNLEQGRCDDLLRKPRWPWPDSCDCPVQPDGQLRQEVGAS